jgi:hypothetical protein
MLTAAALTLAVLGTGAHGAQAKVNGYQVTHFRVYDAGPAIAWEMRICTPQKTKLRFRAESYYRAAKKPRYDSGRGAQRAGCRLWRLEMVNESAFPAGRWRSRMTVAFGPDDTKATPLRAFRIRG